MLRLSLFLVALCVLSWVSMTSATRLTMQIAPKTQECFYEDLEANTDFNVRFEVIRGGLLDIKVRVNSPSKNKMHEKLAFFNKPDDKANEEEGILNLRTTESGVHQVCFDNTMSRWTGKTVTVYFAKENLAEKLEIDPDDEVAKLEHLGPVVDSVIRISEEMDQVQRLQRILRTREQNHRDLQENSNSKTQYLAICESILLIFLTFVQGHYIRSWFGENRHMLQRV